MRLNYTIMRTASEQRVVIPNEKLAGGVMKNDTLVVEVVALDVAIWIPPEADVERAIAALADETGQEVDGRRGGAVGRPAGGRRRSGAAAGPRAARGGAAAPVPARGCALKVCSRTTRTRLGGSPLSHSARIRRRRKGAGPGRYFLLAFLVLLLLRAR